jgi:bifunctional non-homologous end joining protein LigD
MEYVSFEGTIPAGEYGAGEMRIWDRGDYVTIPAGEAATQRARGRLHVELHGERLRGRWHLVRTKLAGKQPSWLLFKSKSEAPRAPAHLVERYFPIMLATLARTVHRDREWLYEHKYDGIRAIGVISGRAIELWSRNQLELSRRFPTIVSALRRLERGEVIVDGEIVALDARGRPSFQLLQRGAGEIVFVVFDLLYAAGADVRALPIEERRARLVRLLRDAPEEIRVAERLGPTAKRALAEARRRGAEGVIAKRRGSAYRPGRSIDWIKLKLRRGQEVAIVGFTPYGPTRARTRVGSLIVGVYEGGAFHYAGGVGTGFTEAQRRELHELLAPDASRAPAVIDAPRIKDVTWVTPRHVAQIELAEWTEDGRVRSASFQGLREDKLPTECVREGEIG